MGLDGVSSSSSSWVCLAVCRESPAGLVKPAGFGEVGAEGLPRGAVAAGMEIVGVEVVAPPEGRSLGAPPAAGACPGVAGRVKGTVAAGAAGDTGTGLGCITGGTPGRPIGTGTGRTGAMGTGIFGITGGTGAMGCCIGTPGACGMGGAMGTGGGMGTPGTPPPCGTAPGGGIGAMGRTGMEGATGTPGGVGIGGAEGGTGGIGGWGAGGVLIAV